MKLKIQTVAVAISVGVLSITAAGLSGCAGNRYEQSTGERIDDPATSMRVKHALNDDPEYKYSMVDVKTFKGVTQLNGFVDTRAQKSRAADIAKGVEGVKEVKNNISVKE